MAVPTSFTGLSTTPASNSPVAGDNVFPDLDDHIRILAAMLASIYANTATNGWVSPYLPLAGGALTGPLTGTVSIADIETNSIVMTGYLKLPAVAVASLTSPATAYLRAFVTDATATTFASIVSGGGSNRVPVFSDGTNWRIG